MERVGDGQVLVKKISQFVAGLASLGAAPRERAETEKLVQCPTSIFYFSGFAPNNCLEEEIQG